MSIWPVREHPGANYTLPQVITHDSHADHHAENWGCDFQANMHDLWDAIAHKGVTWMSIVGRWESLSTCGVACELQWQWNGQVYNLRYCHGHEHYAERWPDIWSSEQVLNGEPIGEVGMTGLTTGPHLHLAASVGAPWGGLLEQGTRVRVEELIAEIQASYEEEPVPAPDFTPEELQALHDAWIVAEWLEKGPAGETAWYGKAIKNTVRLAKGEAIEQ